MVDNTSTSSYTDEEAVNAVKSLRINIIIELISRCLGYLALYMLVLTILTKFDIYVSRPFLIIGVLISLLLGYYLSTKQRLFIILCTTNLNILYLAQRAAEEQNSMKVVIAAKVIEQFVETCKATGFPGIVPCFREDDDTEEEGE